MAGLTNYTRNLVLKALSGEADLPKYDTLWVNLLVTTPSDSGTVNGGLLGQEWSVVRKPISSQLILTTNPRWQITGGIYGGLEMSNNAEFSWDEVDTAGLQNFSSESAAIYDSLTGGNTLAWDFLDQPISLLGSSITSVPIDSFRFRLFGDSDV